MREIVAGTMVTPLRSVIRTLCASTVGEGLAPPEKTKTLVKKREHQGAPLPKSKKRKPPDWVVCCLYKGYEKDIFRGL